MNNTEEFIQKLKSPTNYKELQEQIIIWKRSPEILYELYTSLDNAMEEHGIEENAIKHKKELIFRSLAITLGQDNINYSFKLVRKYVHSLDLRTIASMLAYQDKKDLIDQVDIYDDNSALHGFYWMILQELVIRKELFFGDKRLDKIAEKLGKSKLSNLPLQLTTIETKLYSINFSYYSYGRPTPLFNNQVPIDYTEKEASSNMNIELMIEPFLKKQCLSVLNDWTLNSHGKAEFRCGKMNRPEIPIEEIIGTLYQAEFEEKTILKIAQATPSRIFSMLYSTASNGGAYSRGELGAYGRLKAWYSFLGMCGIPFEKNNITSIIHELDNFVWFEFISNTWFYRQLSWDIGIVCIHIDTNKVYSIIGTDSD